MSRVITDKVLAIAAGINADAEVAATASAKISAADAAAIRSKVAMARQNAPHIPEDTAERWVAEGITPDQAAIRLYDLISEPVEASKIVAAYRATRNKG